MTKRLPPLPSAPPAGAEVAAEPPDVVEGPVAAESQRLWIRIREVGARVTARIRDWGAVLARKRRGRVGRSAAEQPLDLQESESAADGTTEGADAAVQVSGSGLANARDFNPLPAEVGRAESSEAIFAEIGRKLQARREMLSLTYEEIERHTKVRVAFQKALEQGAIESLPSPVQTRGILANYAAFLDLDTDDILLRFADGLQARHREQKPQWQPERTRSPMTVHTDLPPLRSFIASDLIFGGGVAVMLILFALWGIGRVMSVRQQTAVRAQATSPSISEVLAGTAVPTEIQQVTVIPADDTGLAPTFTPEGTIEAATLDPNVPIRVTLSAVRRTFVRVSVDGKVQFEGRLEPGKDYSYGGGSRVEVLVGDASGIKVSFNGRDLGLMGNFGEVVDLIYTAGGAFTPTATLEPTRTPAPVLTGTVSPVPSTTPPATATP